DKRYPGRIETMFRATQNVVPSHLCDTELFDFKNVAHGDTVINGGDLAFDREEIPTQHQVDDDDRPEFTAERLNVIEVK
ncbi:tRNA 2-thiocytidine(32) synthetase TtcA, partial [Klebsiella pneumoniae]|nr:tRNA 2-thiocytidine(32) synthetase TtcA [Klebsiella pneumoniae]